MSRRILVGTRKGLFTVERLASAWEITSVSFLGDNVVMLLPGGRIAATYAALDHGHFGAKLHRSDDEGKTWAEVAAPVYPECDPEEVEKDFWGKTLEWKLDKIWALERGSQAEPDLLWCGTLPGGLFRSNDGGRSWALVETLWRHPKRKQWFGGGADKPGIHSICVDPRDARHVTVGVSCGGVWMTHDAGESWECRATGMWAAYMPPESKEDPNIQDPHRVVQCQANPDCFWAQHHNGIFRSNDGALSWQEVKGGLPTTFGFAVAVHPRDPDTAWFVPGLSDEKRIPLEGRVVVTRTRNGGKSFDTLTRGLPQQHAYDLTFRHALDIDESGDSLAFGSTTGSLWISDDQGDTWISPAEHLPPVYCVRFA
jgi:photosystem II stability/assembly factor-like uncharacterized protein